MKNYALAAIDNKIYSISWLYGKQSNDQRIVVKFVPDVRGEPLWYLKWVREEPQR